MSVINLPEGYVQLEYIEQPLGLDAYINTGMPSSNTLGYEIELMNYDTINNNGHCLFGCRDSGSEFQINSYSNDTSVRHGSVIFGTTAYNAGIEVGEVATISLIDTTLTVNGVSTEVTRNLSVTGRDLYIFCDNYGNKVGSQWGHGRLYKLTIYENGEPVRNFIPCFNPNYVVGLYDTVSNTFFTSANSTVFMPGTETHEDTIENNISNRLLELYGIKENLKNAINSKYTTGPLVSTDGLVEFATAIDNIPVSTIDLPTEPKDVNFIDYDGTLLYAYTAVEFTALNGMPNNPYHTGLIAQGWNWTREQILEYLEYGARIDIGAMYITNDGKTRLYIEKSDSRHLDVHLYFKQSIGNGVSVDWGDESEIETNATLGNVIMTHTYANIGKYMITLSPDNDCMLSFGNQPISSTTSTTTIFGTRDNYGYMFKDLYKVELGKNIWFLAAGSFRYCTQLKTITIPKTIIRIDAGVFEYCTNLKGLTIPKYIAQYGCSNARSLKYCTLSPSFNDETLSQYTFNACRQFEYMLIPNCCIELGANCCPNLVNLQYIYLPNNLQFFRHDALRYCYNLKELHLPNTLEYFGASETDTGYFYGWGSANSLQELVVPEGISNIPPYTFYECQRIAKIDLPSTITTITATGTQFGNCRAFIIRAETPPTLSTSFAYIVAARFHIFVPYSEDHSILEAYKAATNWSTYASSIYELNPDGTLPTLS